MSVVSQREVCYSFPPLCHIDYDTCILHVMNYEQRCLLLFSIRITEALPPCVQRLRAHISLMFPSLSPPSLCSWCLIGTGDAAPILSVLPPPLTL